jgi:uncharacterized membrane protein
MSLHVVVATFQHEGAARDAIANVKDEGIKLVDQAVVVNNGDGNITFKEGKDAGGGKGFVYGASTVAVAGLLLGPVGWGALATGGLLGGLISKVHDAGIPSKDIEALGQSLKPGNAAAIAVTQDGDEDRVLAILHNFGGEVVRVAVTDSARSALDSAAPQGVTVAADGSATEGPAAS